MMGRRQELMQQIGDLRDELNKIEEAKEREELAKIAGRCFVYQNSYGSGSEWPLYQRVFEKGGKYYRLGVQFDQRDQVTVSINAMWGARTMVLGNEISEERFLESVADCQSVIDMFLRNEPPAYWADDED